MRLIALIVTFTALSTSALAADLVSFQSAEGIKRLERSEAKVDFFPLANHFESQENKLFCGVASSTIVLNTLRLQNPAIEKPENKALLSKEERRYLPEGLDPIYQRYTQHMLLSTKAKSKMEVLGKPIKVNGKVMSDYGLQLSQLTALLQSYGLEATKRTVNDSLKEETIRNELIENLKNPGDYVLVNYFRKALGQEGGGHISPLGAYDKESDSFLILDVDPNIANWVWVRVSDLIAAMRTLDTVENRGYVLVKEGKAAE